MDVRFTNRSRITLSLCGLAAVLVIGPAQLAPAETPVDGTAGEPEGRTDQSRQLIVELYQTYEDGSEPALRESVKELADQQIAQLEHELTYVDKAAREQYGRDDHPLASFIFAVRYALVIKDSPPLDLADDGSADISGIDSGAGGGTVSKTSSASGGGGGSASSIGSGSSGGGGGSSGGGGGSGSGGGGSAGGGDSGVGGGGGAPATATASRSPSLRDTNVGGGTAGGVDVITSLGREKIVGFYPIGWSADNDATRNVGWNIQSEGWAAGFVRKRILVDLENGYRRFQLHNPFGTVAGRPMQADQFIEAKQAGLDWLTDGFVEAWKPVIDGQYTNDEPVEVIAYFGTFQGDSDFVELLEDGKTDEWFERAWQSLKPALDAGMSIGLDSVADAPADHPAFELAKQIRDRGHKVYIETWPKAGFEHWNDFNFIVNEPRWEWLHRRNFRANVPRQDITTDVLIIVRPPQDNESFRSLGDKTMRWGTDLMAKGRSILINPLHHAREEIFPYDIARRAFQIQQAD